MTGVLLEVAALHAADAEAADAGGADRVELLARPDDGGFSPDPTTVRAVTRATEVPVRVRLRLSGGYSTTAAEASRLIGLAEHYLSLGAEGVVLGFLDRDLEVAADVTARIIAAIPGAPWTFSEAVDAALDTGRAWRSLMALPRLDAVLTAGSSLGVGHGQDTLIALSRGDRRIAARVLAGSGLSTEHVPWLVRAGIHQFHVGPQVRPGGSWPRAHVDAAHVRAWRLLLDDAVQRVTIAG